MIVFLLLSLCISSLFGHRSVPSTSCSTLNMLYEAKDSLIWCKDSEIKNKCTTASLELVKTCLGDGLTLDQECLHEIYLDLADEEEDMACFCGGLGKFSEMLINVKGLLCEAEEFHNQDHDDDSLLGAAAPSLESSSDSGVLDEGNDATQNQESVTLCSFCTNDIKSAYAECSYHIIKTSIITCINDILGTTSDCRNCVCDVLNYPPILCETEESHDQDHDDDSLLGAAAPSLESSSDSGVLDLYEGNDATQNQVCTLRWGHQDVDFNFKQDDACENDEARSGILRAAAQGTTITLYDSPSGDKGDDYTVIKVKTNSLDDLPQGLTFNSFEESQVYNVGSGTVEMTYYRHNGLDGKISRVDISVF